jgi:hypothetical protein
MDEEENVFNCKVDGYLIYNPFFWLNSLWLLSVFGIAIYWMVRNRKGIKSLINNEAEKTIFIYFRSLN